MARKKHAEVEANVKRWLSYAGVTAKTSLSESTVRRLIREGRFPKPRFITTGRAVFLEVEVERAVEALLETSDRGAA